MALKVQILLNKFLKRCFYQAGFIVGSNPVPIIIICVLSSIILIFTGQHFITRIPSDASILYTPSEAPAIKEYAIAKEFFHTKGNKYLLRMAVLTREKDVNILDGSYPDAVLDLQDYFLNNFTDTPDKVPFSDLCGTSCDSNTVIPRIFALRNSPRKTMITYPAMQAFGMSLYMGDHFHHVTKDAKNVLQSAKSCSLFFKASHASDSQKAILRRWEENVSEHCARDDYPHSNILKVYVYSAGLATTGLNEAGYSAAKYFAVSFICLLVFTVISCLKREPHMSKPWEAVGGIANPLMALMTTFGFMFLIGYNFINALVVCPFLVIAIGVDDCFIMLHAWHMTNGKLAPEERLAQALSSCGPAIALTSLTNTVSFGIGIFSSTPAVSIFCAFTSLGMFVDFIYQITFFAAIIAVGGRREAQKQNAYLCCTSICDSNTKDAGMRSSMSPKLVNTDKIGNLWFKATEKYSQFLISWKARILAILLCIPYWALAIYFTCQMKSTLSSDKLFLRGSSINEFLIWARTTTWLESVPIYIFVKNNPDLSNHERLAEMLNMVNQFENTQFSVGNASTELWLNEYLDFLNFFGAAELTPSQKKYSMENHIYNDGYLEDFFVMQEQWLDKVTFNRTSIHVEKFYFRTSFKDIHTWEEMNKVHKICRNIAGSFKQFQVSIYQPVNSLYADQIDSIATSILRTILLTVLSMGALCILLIPHISSVLSSVLSILSINIGVYGLYYLWSVDLDPVSMMNALFSLGLSIDFVSHVSYHYFLPELENVSVVHRIHSTLLAVAWPILQAGASTLISVSPLWLNGAYLTDVFAKTVLLVVSLGLIHGLFLLPVFLAWVPRALSLCISTTSKVTPVCSNCYISSGNIVNGNFPVGAVNS